MNDRILKKGEDKMIRCQLALLAKGVIRDFESGGISVYHIIEDIQTIAFPVFFPEVWFFAYLVRDDSDPSTMENIFRIRIDADLIAEMIMKPDFEGKRGNRLIVRIGGLLIPRPGMLYAELLSKEADARIGLVEVKVSSMELKPKVEDRTPPSSSPVSHT